MARLVKAYFGGDERAALIDALHEESILASERHFYFYGPWGRATPDGTGFIVVNKHDKALAQKIIRRELKKLNHPVKENLGLSKNTNSPFSESLPSRKVLYIIILAALALAACVGHYGLNSP